MWKKIFLLFVILCLLITLVGCGGGESPGYTTPPIPPEPIETIIPDTTKVTDKETEKEIVSVTEDQSTIVFEKSTSQLEELSPGDIIVMGVTKNTPEGLLRKVTNITKGGKDGSQVVVETEFASIEEAIEQGSFEFDITLEPEDIERGISYPKGVRPIRDKFETGYSFSYELDKVLCNNHLIVDGELSFDYHILLNGTIGFFKLKTLEFKNTVESKAELNVTLTDAFSVGDLLDDNPKTIFSIPFKEITVWVSYVPIVLKPQINVNVGLDGEIFAELTTGVTISQENEGAYVAGVEFDNGVWKEIKNEPVFAFEYREPSLSAEAKIKAYAGPQLELMLYGFVGPHCNIYGYLDFEADIWDDPWWELYAGLDVTAGLQLEIITKFWSAVYSSPEFDIINYRTPEPIAQADGPFGGTNHPPVISDLTANPPSIDINQTTTITCDASDEDGDALTYTWSENGGIISGSGSTITWTAPSTQGNYTIECEVSDGQENDSKSVAVTVNDPGSSNHPPVISDLTANPPSIDINQTTTITCDASDEDGDALTYTWSENGGIISGSGSTITWTAPSTAGTYTITCMVSDGNGGEATKSVAVIVGNSVGNKIFLQSGGTLNGASINPSNPTLTVNTGESITGTLKVQAIYSGPSNNVVPFGYTPSWGSHSGSYVTVNGWIPVGATTYTVPISLTAPNDAGTYYLIFASNCEMNLGWTMSQTNWTTGTMYWNDGNDIADLTESKLQSSLSTGYLYLDMLVGSSYKTSTYGIAYVKIVVTGTKTLQSLTVVPDTMSFTAAGQTEYISEIILGWLWSNGAITTSSLAKGDATYSGYNTSVVKVVMVIPNVKVESVGEGSTNIKVSYTDNGITKYDYIAVTVAGTPPPTGVSATDGTYTDKIRITWNNVTGATHYKVYRARASNDTKVALTGWQTNTSYDDTSADFCWFYSYWVKAATSNSGANASGYSTYNTGWRRLEAPQNVTASWGEVGKTVISWDPVERAVYYRVYRGLSTGSKIPITDWFQTGSYQYNDYTGEVNKIYYYWVKAAYNTSGLMESDWSDFVFGYRK